MYRLTCLKITNLVAEEKLGVIFLLSWGSNPLQNCGGLVSTSLNLSLIKGLVLQHLTRRAKDRYLSMGFKKEGIVSSLLAQLLRELSW